MVAPTRLLQKQQVACHHDVLGLAGNARKPQTRRPLAFVHDAPTGEGEVLRMLDHRQVEVLGIEQGAAHQLGVGDRVPIVRDCHHSGRYHVADLGQLLPLLPLAHRTDGIDPGKSVPPGLGGDVLADRPVVVDRLGVGHTRHGRKAAGGRRQRATADGLFVLLPRLAQMDVHVDEARGHHLTRGVHHFGTPGPGDFLVHPGDVAVFHQYLVRAVQILARVNHPPAAKQQLHAAS